MHVVHVVVMVDMMVMDDVMVHRMVHGMMMHRVIHRMLHRGAGRRRGLGDGVARKSGGERDGGKNRSDHWRISSPGEGAKNARGGKVRQSP
jgi:hypothetical protein